jgi:hypothetical protein
VRRYTETGPTSEYDNAPRPRRIIEFDTFTEFLNFAEGPCHLPNGQRSSRHQGHEGNFYHHESWPEMVYKARTGSPELVARAMAIKDRAVKDSAREMPQTLYDRVDSDGLYFDAGLVAEGQPDCWLVPRDANPVEAKTIKLVYNCSVSCGATVETLIERGAGMMALAQLLKMQGRNVEIWVTRSANFSGTVHEIRVKVKDIGADGQDDQLAFVLVSPDMLRRLCFSVEEIEHLPDAYNGGGYGCPCLCLLTGDVTVQHRYGGGATINAWVKDQLDKLVNATDEFAG